MTLSRGARRLQDLVRWFLKRFGRAFPNQATIARLLAASVRSVKRWLAELVAAGIVAVQRRYRRSNEYRLVGSQTLSSKPVGPILGPTVVKTCSLSILRREITSPLVIFRNVYRAMSRKKPKPKPPSLYERLKAGGFCD